MAVVLLFLRTDSVLGGGQHGQQRDHPGTGHLVVPAGGLVQPAGRDQLPQVVVELPGGSQPGVGLQVGDRAGARQDQLREQQPDGVTQRGDGLAASGPVGGLQVGGGTPVLPQVLAALGQRDDAGEDNGSCSGRQPRP